MTDNLLLVDFENVQDVDLSTIPTDVRVRLVLGAKLGKLPTELAIQAQAMGDRFAYVPIKGQAPNAVDFCVAFYLGEYLARNPAAECVILSKDKKGFDPLVKHLVSERKFKVRRVNSQKEAYTPKAVPKSSSVDEYSRTISLLSKEKSFPKKLVGLDGKIRSYFPDKSPEERIKLIERLLREGRVSEVDGNLTYLK